MLVSIRRIAARTARMAIRSCALKSCSNGLETASLNLRRQYSAQEDICSSIKASSRTRRRKMGSVAHNVPPPSPFPPSCYRSGQKKKKKKKKKKEWRVSKAGYATYFCINPGFIFRDRLLPLVESLPWKGNPGAKIEPTAPRGFSSILCFKKSDPEF